MRQQICLSGTMDCLRKIGKYEVLSSILGDGGFCCVYPCQYESDTSGKSVAVAVKISLVPVEDTTYDMKWTAHKREWQMYQTMAFGRTKDSQGSGIPAVYECGFVQTLLGTHLWMSMQLLGPDLRKLAANGCIIQNINFVKYATGMLTALQHVHKHGIVHKDVKPANFCLGAIDTCYSDKVYIVDFGLAGLIPAQEQTAQDKDYIYTNFQGTPDYASSDALNSMICSAKDDLESLGYTFLEMLEGDLPWDLTSNVAYDDGDYFSQEQLSNMSLKRDRHWEQLCAQGKIPIFLVNWHRYVRGLKTFDTPSYAWLFHLLQHSQDTTPSPLKRLRESAQGADQALSKTKKQKVAECYAEE